MNVSEPKERPSASSKPWLTGGGDMGERIRARDWSTSPLGPLASWPQSLRTAVSLCLESNLPIAIVWGPRRVMLYNDAYRPLCGEGHPRLLGGDFSECWRSLWPTLGARFAEALAGQPSCLEHQRLSLEREGRRQEASFTFSFSPLRDESGQVVGVFNPCTELSAQFLDERGGAGRAHRARLHDLFMDAPAGIAVITGPEHVFEFMNARYETLTQRHQALGKPFREVFPELEAQGFFGLLDTVYREGKPFVGHEMAVRFDRKGEGRLEEAFFTFSVQPLMALQGPIQGVVISVFEVTEWVRSRQQVEQRAAELEAVLRSIPDGVCVTDATGTLLVNRIEQELLRSTEIQQALHHALRGETSTRELTLRRDTTGEERIIRSSTGPVRLRERIVGAVSLNLDITEHKHAQVERELLLESEQTARSAAERANQRKDEFLARISHELATPLVGMRLWLDLLESDEGKRAEALASLRQCVRTQSKLVHDLLDTARALNGKLSVVLEACEPDEPLQSAVSAILPFAETKGVVLKVGLRQTPLVQADPERLKQVLSNLLSNAVKFTPPGGKVEVRLEPGREGVCFVVSDTGRGFPADFQPLLFTPFRQEEEGTTRSNGGLGLGLAIVRQLVELHGGKVWAESPGRGQGATFTVWLPPFDETTGDEREERPDELGRQLEGIRLLLVEDDALLRSAVASVLEQQGAQVDAVESAEAALERLRGARFDVLLCDIAMPGEDGYSLIRKVRAMEAPVGQLPAAAFTAHMREQDRAHALLAGFQMHIPKSTEPAQLIARLLLLVQERAGEG